MHIEIKKVETKSDLKSFIFLSEKIHSGHLNWVYPIYSDERIFFNPKKNKNFKSSDTILALANKNGEIVGRIMGIINHHYNAMHNVKTARFFNLDCLNDPNISHALIDFIEKWAIGRGMNRIIGPYGFSDKDPQGLMIEGYENTPALATNFNFPYLVELVEKEGYSKEIDCFSYKLPIPDEVPDIYNKVLLRILKNNKLNLLEFTSRFKMKKYIVPLFRLVNETYKDLYGFVPLDEKEMHEFANRYLPILDPRFIKVVLDNRNEVIAFVIAMPDISKGINAAKGKLFPFGFIKILRSAKKSKQLNLLLGAVKEEYRGVGFDVLLGSKLIESAKKRGMTMIDSHLILETNYKMRGELEKLGGVVYKKYRVYQKSL